MIRYAIAFLLFFATPVTAEVTSCTTSIKGVNTSLTYDDDDMSIYDNFTFREIFFAGWGEITCPSFITLRHLTPDLTDHQREPFCLSYDPEQETYVGFEQGDRDAYGICKAPSKTLCERVNSSKDALLAVSGLAAGASGGATTVASAAGVTAVTHSSGALILTGSSGYIAGTLGTAGATALGILTAPATLTGAAISLVAIGGAVYVCQD